MIRLVVFLSLFIIGPLLASNLNIEKLLEAQRIEVTSFPEKFINQESSPVNFTCVTEIPTTSVVVFTQDNIVTLRVIHHFGLLYSPIHSGIVTMNDLDSIKAKGEFLHKFGQQYDVEFDQANCRKNSEGNWGCFHNGASQIGSLPVSGYSFQTYTSSTKLFGIDFETLHFKFSATSQSQSLSMDMEYSLYSNECSFN